MKLRLALSVGLLVSGHAMAQDVYPGCEVPAPPASHNTFYIDPVHGADSGDGSAQRPWKSLNTVLAQTSKLIATNIHTTMTGSPLTAANPSAPIKTGDTIMLMSGDYGDVYLNNAFNDKFITVTAAPGQVPIIQHLKLGGATRWMFQGLTFQSSYPSGSLQNANAQVSIYDGWGDLTKNIVFDKDTFQSVADASTWSDADWFSRPNYFTLLIRSNCVTATNSTLKNLINGINVVGTQVLLKGNTIDGYSNDGMEITTSNVAIVSNTIKNGMHNAASGMHPDSIQVWSPTVSGAIVRSSNLLIDSNQILNPYKRPDNFAQGITIGYYDNVTVRNNVVVTNVWSGISMGGSRNSQIINNTVMPSDPVGHPTWIIVSPDQGNSQNVVIRNNVATLIRAEDQSITMDHNTAGQAFSTLVGGKGVLTSKSDTVAQNLVQPTLNSDFRSWNPTNSAFDLHLASTSPLDKAGSSSLAPAFDADGRPRAQPVDLGAYTR